MKLSVVARTLGVLLVFFSITLVLPLAVSLIYREGEAAHFLDATAIAFTAGLALWFPWRRDVTVVHTRESFAIVATLWTAMSVLGAIPFVLTLNMSYVDALFESASGYTTTGATVLAGLDELPKSILFYRQELQWLGGIGVVVLAMALLPLLGVGGMQLYKAEVPGPFKDDRLTPRIARTARSLSELYVVLTLLCAACFWWAGMSVFDAISHAMSTLSTGGYSTHDASIGYFNSPLIEAVAIVFMLIGSINFGIHFMAWRALKLRVYSQDAQTRIFLAIVLVLSAYVAYTLYSTGTYSSPLQALRHGTLQIVSAITTTGFSTAVFAQWPLALPVVVLFASFVGGSAGSTAGGLKVVRFVILAKQASVQLRQLSHPRMVHPIKLDGHQVPRNVVQGIWGFFTVYIVVFAVFMILLMIDGMDQVTAFGAVATALNNLGPGLGQVATDFIGASPMAKVIVALAMLLGRLEIFTFLVLFTPSFWRN